MGSDRKKSRRNTQAVEAEDTLPVDAPATAHETICALVDRSARKGSFPMRRDFVQQGPQNQPRPGPLAGFVRNHDERGLDTYLLGACMISSPPWTVAEHSAILARALSIGGPNSRAAVSRIWRRLEGNGLVTRHREGRKLVVTYLREDGGGGVYTRPGDPSERKEIYFQVPLDYWTADARWYATLTLPAKVLLLIALSLGNGFVLPYERARAWYGISADTAERGLRELQDRGLLGAVNQPKTTPLAPAGITLVRRYTLREPFGLGRPR